MFRKKLQTVALTAAGVVIGLIVVCGVLIFLGGGQSAAAQQSASDLTPRAYLPLILNSIPQPIASWIEVVRSPGQENGWQTLGRWRRVSQGQGGDAYPGCISASDPGCVYHPYEPTTGSNASWWTVGYNDSAWSAQGYVDWNSAWTTYGWTPIPTIGEHVWKAEPGWPAGATDLHRRTFEIAPGCSVLDARLTLFSDNHSRWYINGTLVVQSEASASRLVSIPIAPFHSGSNLLAMQVNNDHVSLTNNPFGIQYILEVQLLCVTPTPTPTKTPTSTPTSTPTKTPTPTPTNTPTSTPTTTPTNTPTPTPTSTPTNTPTSTPTTTPTNTPTPTPTNTPTPTSTNTPIPNPEIRLTKSPNPSIYTAPGQVITYTYSVINTGNVRLRGPVTVFDDKAIVTCPDVSTVGNGDGFLDPGESLTCSASYVVTQADLNACLVTNNAVAQVDSVTSNPAQATINCARLLLTKSANPTTYTSAGQLIVYTYAVTNTGNVTLSGPIIITDDKLGTFPCGFAPSLAPGASVACTRIYIVQPSDLLTITSAKFEIYSLGVTNQTVSLHRVITPWIESQVTWNNFGGSFDPAVIGSFTTEASGWRAVDVTAPVSAWANGTSPNYGILLEQGLTSYTTYASSEYGDSTVHPKLTITYTLAGSGSPLSMTIQRGPTMPTAVPDAYIWQAAPDQNEGGASVLYTGLVGSGEKQSLLRFDFTLPCTQITNHATATATVSGITVTSNPAQATVRQACAASMAAPAPVRQAATWLYPTATHTFLTSLINTAISASQDRLALKPKF